ncbi:MAG: hypothetical protein SOH81_09515 [Acetobacter sp.]|jgi:hypothetical protein
MRLIAECFSYATGRAALAAGRNLNVSVTLVSPENAASFMGVSWWQALVKKLSPHKDIDNILDCGEAAGRAMEALHAGQKQIVLSRSGPQAVIVQSFASLVSAKVFPTRPDAVKLNEYVPPEILVRRYEEMYLISASRSHRPHAGAELQGVSK